jgi:hypothetical protein
MDFVRVITGRFERNPPLYYKMRLERVTKKLASHPEKLENYDNAAVASDRLGDDKKAIEWIEKKRAFMVSHGITPKSNSEAWYRYYANAGTFRAHLWLRNGANRENTTDLAKARDLIAKALEINPNSHFGRESAQLETIKWLLSRDEPTLSRHFDALHDWKSAEKDAKGLAGLVALGSAWESVDLFAALQNRLSAMRYGSLAHFAKLRAAELLENGAKPMEEIRSADDLRYSRNHPWESVEDFNKREYRRLRQEADRWSSSRTAFMMARLQKGRHPDTDPDFWTGYQEAPAPQVRSQPYFTSPRGVTALQIAAFFGLLFLFIGLPILLIPKAVRAWKSRRSRMAQ